MPGSWRQLSSRVDDSWWSTTPDDGSGEFVALRAEAPGRRKLAQLPQVCQVDQDLVNVCRVVRRL